MPLFRRRGKGRASGGGEDSNSSGGAREAQPLTPYGGDDSSSASSSGNPSVDERVNEAAKEVMKNNLDIMRDIVMKIRDEDGYAKGMYANCPRLQHLLDRNPDLRPVFEDPRLVRINFETVYKEAGGILPEDEEAEEAKKKKPSLIVRIAQHPIFRVLKVLLFVKKIIGCIAGGGIAIVTSCYFCCADCCTDCCCEDALEEIGEIDDGDPDDPGSDYGLDPEAPLDENQQALNTAADYMEDPDVQEQMQRLLEDPENLEDAIENDAELRTLRDSNPLCAELMQDPETMKILTDPDNLRALGEAPQLIELDFADPEGFVADPDNDFADIEAGNLEGLDESGDFYPGLDASGSIDGLEAFEGGEYDYTEEFEMDDNADDGIEEEVGFDDDDYYDDEDLLGLGEDEDLLGFGEDDGLDAGEAEPELTVEDGAADAEAAAAAAESTGGGGWEDDFAMEQQDVDVDADVDAGGADAEAANKAQKGKAKNERKQPEGPKKGGMAGVMASLGVAATDVIASQIVGQVFGDGMIPLDFMSGGDMGPDLGGLESAADQADDLVNDDVAGLAEDTVDDVDGEKDSDDEEDKKQQQQQQRRRSSSSMAMAVFDKDGRRVRQPLGATIEEEDEDSSIDDGLESINSNESELFDDEADSDIDDDASADDDKPKKPQNKFIGALKNLASATATAAKEHVVSNLIGDDFAEMLVEKQEEMGESDSDDDDDDDDDDDPVPQGGIARQLTMVA